MDVLPGMVAVGRLTKMFRPLVGGLVGAVLVFRSNDTSNNDQRNVDKHYKRS